MRFALICALLGVLVSHFSSAVVFRFTNFVCKSHNESWFVFHTCRLKALSREKVAVNVNGTILYSANNIYARGKMFKRASGLKPWLFDVKVDVCRFFRNKNDPFGKIIFNLFEEFTNFNHTCPYKGPQFLQGFYLKPEKLRLPIPTGVYMLAIRWFFDQKLTFDTNASFEFVEDLKTS